ncbi:hypothetical protein [Phenylobacterium sp.]|uniref:hypothetical protein n=1 Tax=Phenylobacterium sp. TaxID=1871053 RepID=UPI002F41C1DC
MSPIDPYDDPTDADSIDGEVVLIGPGTIAASMTPKAAAETARRLRHAARKACGQAAPSTPESDDG